MYGCMICDKSYKFRKSLYRHRREIHNIPTVPIRKQYRCEICNKIYSRKEDLIAHVRTHNRKNRSRIICPVEKCRQHFKAYSHLHTHLIEIHDIKLGVEQHEFIDENEFTQWKSRVEKSLNASYIKNTNLKQLKNGDRRLYYTCHRSHFPLLIQNRKRSLKRIGSNKISRACPSRLVATFADDKISVVFYPDHVGHKCEANRLRLSTQERNNLAVKLSLGEPIAKVLRDVKEASTEAPNRIHLIGTRDLHNIKRDYAIKTKEKGCNNNCKIKTCNCSGDVAPLKTAEEIAFDQIFNDGTNDNYVSDYREIIASKLDILLSLNGKVSLEENDYLHVSKQLNDLIEIFKVKKIKFSSSNENVINKTSSDMALIVHTGFDHMYC